MKDDYPNNLPDPEVVARAAAEAAAPRVLEDYCDAIQILREKKFTFREIAEWLGKNFGIQADHNSVWRAHTKYMDDYTAAHLEAKEDEELERDEALAEAEANGTLRVLPPACPRNRSNCRGKSPDDSPPKPLLKKTKPKRKK